MEEKTEKILNKDSVAETEMLLGKDWNQFSDSENMFMILKNIIDREQKENHLKNLGDTYFSMPWEDFKNLLLKKGFIDSYSYNFFPDERCEEQIIYCHPEKGWIISANSFMGDINGGNFYGEIKANGEEDKDSIWRWLSTGGLLDHENLIFETSHDVREGLFSKLEELEKHGTFLSKWINHKAWLWFLDYSETKTENYDSKFITQSKIEKCSQQLRDIIGR